MRQERFGKNARIPVHVRDGKIEFLYDAEFPVLEEGATGEIVLDARLVSSPQWRQFLTGGQPDTLELAPAGTLAALSISVRKCGRDLKQHLVSRAQAHQLAGAPQSHDGSDDAPWNPGNGYQVLGELQDALVLRLTGQNLWRLEPCAVVIPALRELQKPFEALSLDQALWLVSHNFEPTRRGRNTNIFGEVHLLVANKWVLLDDLRTQREAQNQDAQWEMVGLDPQKVRARIANMGGLLPNDLTRKTD
jgi:hypothetical protein